MKLIETLINEALNNSRGLKYIIAVGKIYGLEKVIDAVTTAKRDLNYAIEVANTYEQDWDYDPKAGEWVAVDVRMPRLKLLQRNMPFPEAISQVIKEEMIRAMDNEKLMSATPICPFTVTPCDELPF